MATLAARSTPLERADKLIVSFVDDNKGAEQQHKATMLFAGLFGLASLLLFVFLYWQTSGYI